MKPFIRPTISVVLILLSVLGMLNVYSDNSEVEQLARQSVCAACESSALRLAVVSRTPLSQTFHFDKATGPAIGNSQLPPGPWPKVIECSRSAVFFGDYSCKQQ